MPEPRIPSDADRITITAGGMQGLDLACKIFINPGDLVIVESPTYTNGSATALSYGAELLEAPVDEDGLIVEALPGPRRRRRAGRRRPSTRSPTSRIPSGVTLSLERRHRLLELAHEWNAVIIDDDPYGLLRFQGEDLPSFQALSPGDPLLFSVRTFSKILAPGLRVGWVDTDPALRQLVINAKQAMDTCTNVPAQHIVAEFIRRGGLDDHLAGLRTEYKRRKDAMQENLHRHLGRPRHHHRSRGRLLPLAHPAGRGRPDFHAEAVRDGTGRRRRLHPRAGAVRRAESSTTPCGCASRPPLPSGLRKAFSG